MFNGKPRVARFIGARAIWKIAILSTSFIFLTVAATPRQPINAAPSPQTGYAYDVTISRSFDRGKTWGKTIVPHRDGTKAEHGFVSLFAAKDGSLAAVWLDGRVMKADPNDAHGHGHGNMTLRYVKIKRDGSLADEAALDTRVCECCQTSAAMTAEGPVVVYRDRPEGEKEIRDISIVRLKGNKWSAPRLVFQGGKSHRQP